MSEENKKVVISKDTVTRLLSDVKDMIKNPLISENIYYVHDDADMLKGYALIFGPKDCVYEGGAYFFEFNFPSNYPYSPPRVTYHTNDGRTRFNPNLYRNGKVCVSVLNTWKGEQWSSCQTIRSVLLTLLTLFHNDPIVNEPGFKKDDPEAEKYNEILEFKNYEVAIVGMLTKKYLPHSFLPFYTFIVDHFVKNADKIKKHLEKKVKFNNFLNDGSVKIVQTRIYAMCIQIDYESLYNFFMECCYKPLIVNKTSNFCVDNVFDIDENNNIIVKVD